MPINTPTGYLDITNATLRGSQIVTTGYVGIANANPVNHLSVGSNLHINDTHSNVLQISGNINAAGVVLGGISIAPTFDLEIVSNTGNTTPYTLEFNNAATAFVTTANAIIGDTLTASKLVGDGSALSGIQSSNVSDFASNVTRITTLESDLGSNVTRIETLESEDLTIGGEKTFSSNLEVGTANLFVDTQTGGVGIGKTNPGYTLDVNGDINFTGTFYQGGSPFVSSLWTDGADSLYYRSNVEVGTANLFVDTTTGNVGIGMTDPGHNLDIVSEMNLRSVSNTASIKYNSNVVTEFVRSKKLIKYPRVAMTADSYGGYVASASSDNSGNNPAYKVFDHSTSDGWSTSGTYTPSGGFGIPTNSPPTLNGTGVPGEYLILQLPHKLRFSSVKLMPRGTNTDRCAESGNIYGSDDGTNWQIITSFSGKTYTSGSFTTIDINASTAYYRFAIVVTRIGNTANGVNTSIGEMELYGVPEYDPEAHGTDVIVRSVPNVPNTDWLEVYYDGQDYTSMPATVTDKSGNGVTGTPSGVTFDSTWQAFSFDGSGDVITNTRSGYTGSGVYTASTWVNIREEAAGVTFQAVFQYGNGQTSTTDTAIGLGFRTDGAIRPFIYGNINLDVYGHKQYNTWTHFTAIYVLSSSGAKITFYINGEEVGFKSSSTGAAIGATPHLRIGAQANNSDSPISATYLHGSIANFRLFNRALTSDEVWQLYAYQKEYFGHGDLSMTLKAGRLGIGTSEPRAVLDVRGSIDITGELVSSFTGQHVCFPDGDMEQGLVVSANKNKYVSLNGIATGSSAIRSDESLPVVSLSNVMNDSSVFGVVHELEKGGTSRLRTTGGINTKTPKIKGDDRAVVNSLGEGAMWVVNTNGNLVSGDYITTSNVAGYGQRQDDDLLHNYTVAKITMDCDFNPQELPVQVIKSELDSYGRLQWEDDPSGASEKAYKIRYLTTDGQQTDEANCVYRAAYVGCTYHCG